ncbi:MAG TPA: leucine-rich repeat protein [Ruminococcus sp.]|nr:leucine-rich repeat protein [Ruminococcus sp.]
MKIKKTAAIIIAATSMGVSLAAPYSAAMPVMPVYAVEEEYTFDDLIRDTIEYGYADGYIDGLFYKKYEDDNGETSLYVMLADNTLKSVVIPSEIEGIPVKRIEGFNYAFERKIKYEVESLVISDGVEEITNNAFYYCNDLKYVSIPKSVIRIDEDTFYNCKSVETLELGTPDLTDIYCTEKLDFLSVMYYMSTGVMSVKYDLTPLMGPSLKKLVIKDGSVFVPRIENATQELLDSFEIPSSVKILFGARGDFESITIPKNIEYIANGAFMESKNLKEVNFEEGFKGHICENAFELCESIEELDIPSGVTVDSRAFSACNGLKNVSVPFSLFTISEEEEKMNGDFFPFFWVFDNSTSLEKITIKDDPDGNTVFTLPENSGYYLFSDDFFPSLKTLCFPDSVTEIGEYALGYAETLETVKLPANLEKIGKGAFSDSKSLKEINIPESVTEIGGGAFSGCETLENVTIPSGVTEIKNYTFNGCRKLQKINIPDSVTVIGGFAFCDCDSLTEISIPGDVMEIGGGAFYDCSSLKKVILPESVKSIGKYAFVQSGIEKIDIPEGVAVIEDDSFYDCQNLTDITIRNRECEIGNIMDYKANDIVVHGYKGSTAEKYADNKGYTFVPLDGSESTVIGDANLDGDVSLADALLILQHVANGQKYEMSEQAELNADVYNRGDGLTAMDALTIQKYDAKLVTTLPESYQK